MQTSDKRKTPDVARATAFLAVGALCGSALGMTGGAFGDSADPAAAAQPGTGKCSVKKLEEPDGTTSSEVTGGSSDGELHIGYTHAGGSTQAALWSLGEPDYELPDVDGFSPTGVNDDNIVVGTGDGERASDRTSYLYYDGEIRTLEAPEGETAAVTDINTAGDSVGHGSDGSALLWRLDSEDEPRKLSSPHGDARALSIGDNGRASGSADAEDGGTIPVLWHADGEFDELPGLDGAEHGVAASVSGDFAVGTSGPSPDASTDVMWNLAENSVAELPDSLDEANDINESGVVAATTDDGNAAIVDDGEVTALPPLAAGESKAESITDSGQVAGSSQDATGHWHAVVWSGC